MGASSSKATRGAARKYPAQASKAATALSSGAAEQPAAATRRNANATHGRSELSETVTGDFSQRLQQMGVVQPNPTYSSSSIASEAFTHNPETTSAPPRPTTFPRARGNQTVSALEARQQLQHLAGQDYEAMGRTSTTGRRFLDMRTLIEAMKLRDRGVPLVEIESRLHLQPNLLQKLGRGAILSHVS